MSTVLSNVWFPSFYGFYETLFSPHYRLEDSELEEYLELDNLPDNVWDYFENEEYENAVGESCIDTIIADLQEVFGDIITAKFTEIWSPRFYNYENDRLYAEVTISDMKQFNAILGKWIAAHRDYLTKRIKENFTSRDGFWSFYPNDFHEFLAEMEPGNLPWSYILKYIAEYDYYNSRYEYCNDYDDHLYEYCEVYPESYFNIPDSLRAA